MSAPLTANSCESLADQLSPRDAVESCLWANGHPQLQRIRVEESLNEDVILLSGVVRSYFLKQLAQAVSLAAPGVRVIRNEIQVR